MIMFIVVTFAALLMNPSAKEMIGIWFFSGAQKQQCMLVKYPFIMLLLSSKMMIQSRVFFDSESLLSYQTLFFIFYFFCLLGCSPSVLISDILWQYDDTESPTSSLQMLRREDDFGNYLAFSPYI